MECLPKKRDGNLNSTGTQDNGEQGTYKAWKYHAYGTNATDGPETQTWMKEFKITLGSTNKNPQ